MFALFGTVKLFVSQLYSTIKSYQEHIVEQVKYVYLYIVFQLDSIVRSAFVQILLMVPLVYYILITYLQHEQSSGRSLLLLSRYFQQS